MTSRILKTEDELDDWIALLRQRKLPQSVSADDGRKRSIEQNRLQRLWMNEIAEQLGEYKPEYYRGWCKAWFGVPILCAESDEYSAVYDRIFRPLSYEQKIEMMQRPIDYPITRQMTVSQKRQYLDEVYRHFSHKGVKLTEPDNGA